MFGNILGIDLGRYFVVFLLSLFIIRTIDNLWQKKINIKLKDIYAF
jgi:hypothetical protein